ncbi:alpha/beta fold hydrolase [Azomonas macrocytogenes]|uniref:Pimeloyl-[acyl-carrier protein] methyl ester esterase n=1 Tax=Azomonas macrocytogenes TaxID=69962 RepID=A0A839T038_AZOMA|nr:alpha/beta fold hydrolase [Azomonas macrocytogenes]MBB3102931.1 pimeloyl-[acyl-carrier protein] methyl ester esterase [Azomonas macrocytogenes]
MRERLILLPGWAFEPAALDPLRECLIQQAPWLDVEIAPLPALLQGDAWLDELHLRLSEASWLAGWSLGGMLAAQLAARRGHACRGLITLGSNASFRSRDGWPTAMPVKVFNDFCRAFELDPEETLKRFSLLCSRGGFDPKTLGRQLQVIMLNKPAAVLAAGLQLLERLDNRHALQKYTGPQLHVFAERDVLVSQAAAAALRSLLPAAQVEIVAEASHGLPLERPDDVAQLMLDFLGSRR